MNILSDINRSMAQKRLGTPAVVDHLQILDIKMLNLRAEIHMFCAKFTQRGKLVLYLKVYI